MSRIGKQIIKLDDKVKCVVQGSEVSLDGPKGRLSVRIPSPQIEVAVDGRTVTVTRAADGIRLRALHGLTRANLANAATGVSKSWERVLSLRGVGYRAEVKGRQLHMSLGYSHPVVFDIPEGVSAEVAKTPRTEDQLPTVDITLKSPDRQLLGETAVRVRSLRPPEPYKGKGIKLSDERVRRKEGKSGAT